LYQSLFQPEWSHEIFPNRSWLILPRQTGFRVLVRFGEVSGTEENIPERETEREILVPVALLNRMMDTMKPRFGKDITERSVGDLRVCVCHLTHKPQDQAVNDHLWGANGNQKAHWDQNHRYPQRVLEPMVIVVEGVQLLNGVVYGVNSPKSSNSMLRPVKPIIEKIIDE
jgi:hypothetical protein